jgi:hypothetical protein
MISDLQDRLPADAELSSVHFGVVEILGEWCVQMEARFVHGGGTAQIHVLMKPAPSLELAELQCLAMGESFSQMETDAGVRHQLVHHTLPINDGSN